MIDEPLTFYHVIDLPDGTSTPGIVDRREVFPHVGVAEDLSGKRVLDVGAMDGSISFDAERRNAEYVKAVDAEIYENYDWGWGGPVYSDEKDKRTNFISNTRKDSVFFHLKDIFNSSVDRECKSVYELDPHKDGTYDLIFFFGVLYHLRHPLLALDKLRAVCSDTIVIETHVCNTDPMLPSSLFYHDDVLKDSHTNWTGPSESCVVSWMLNAGFKEIFVSKYQQNGRQIFIGFVNNDSDTVLVNNDEFFKCESQYFDVIRLTTSHTLSVGTFNRNWSRTKR